MEQPERPEWLFPPLGRRPNGFLGLSLVDRTILFLVILLESHSRTERLFYFFSKLHAPQNLQYNDRDRAKEIDDCKLTVGL